MSTAEVAAAQPSERSPPGHRTQPADLAGLLNAVSRGPTQKQLPDNKLTDSPLDRDKPDHGTNPLSEVAALEQFSCTYQNERQFSSHHQRALFADILSKLVQERLSSSTWLMGAPQQHVLLVLVCMRILLRDSSMHRVFCESDGISVLAQHLEKITNGYLVHGDTPFVVDVLKEMTNIFQKLSTVMQQRHLLVASGVHKALVLLLSTSDIIVLHCTLHALIGLAQSSEPRVIITGLNAIETILRILQEYDVLSKKLAATLLRLLCADSPAREMVRLYDGVPLLLSLLHCDNVKLLWNVVWCLVQMAGDSETSADIRQMGGIPLILSLLHGRNFVSDRSSVSYATSTELVTPIEEAYSPWVHDGLDLLSESKDGTQTEEVQERQLSLKSACCACLTELVLNDTNAQQIVQSNGIYSVGLFILPASYEERERESRACHTLQANALRTLRFLFSLERNRKLFKRLFPPDLFATFIDLGHYEKDLDLYKPLAQACRDLSRDALREVGESLEAVNQNKPPSHFIGDYAVLDLLGAGAFGCVYRVRKRDVTAGQSYLAMKEVNTLRPSWGESSRDRQTSVGAAVAELTIIREQMKHPNVVRYYQTFVQQDKLYIVMELIEGSPLGEHFSFLREKGERFGEDRVWSIFIQIVLALRYLHKEKQIVHRDLTPNNIMLGEKDKVTITDFGLAKQKQLDCSKMTSVVGTILYSCPEILQHEPYGEKSDIWAVGCVLYQMCTLRPPFHSSNMLTLATKIVEAEYDPLPPGEYSEKVVTTIDRCLTADPDLRPDIVEVAAHIADVMLVHMDELRKEQSSLQRRLEREQGRTQRHFCEATRNMQDYHRLFLASQERYDKLVNLASSGGGSSIKDEAELAGVISESATGGSTAACNGDAAAAEIGGVDESAAIGPRVQSPKTPHCVSTNGGHQVVPRPPDPTTRRSRRKSLADDSPSSSLPNMHQLTLQIPTNHSRDSGLGSAESACDRDLAISDPATPSDFVTPPDPTTPSDPARTSLDARSVGHHVTAVAALRSRSHKVQRSTSTPTLDVGRRGGSAGRPRPGSATTAMLTISPRKVRQITDPILQMLHLLHKIIYITQLPPTLCHNPRRRVIEKLKRSLFAPQSTSFDLKNELRKLLTGSREIIDLNFGPSESCKLTRQVNEECESEPGVGVYDTDAGDVGITYEQMQSITESILTESGYYDMAPVTRVPPLPTGGSTVGRHS